MAALKGRAEVELYRQPRPAPGKRARRPEIDPAAWDGVDRELFEALRQCRLEVARARGVPPYVVFHDNTLRDLARRRPTTPDELLQVYGIGARKAEDLGPIVLDVIRDHRGGTPGPRLSPAAAPPFTPEPSQADRRPAPSPGRGPPRAPRTRPTPRCPLTCRRKPRQAKLGPRIARGRPERAVALNVDATYN